MALTITRKKRPKGQRGHSLALPVTISLDQPAWLNVGHLETIFGRSHSTIYAWKNSGRLPQPDTYDADRPVWKTETIRKFREAQANAVKVPRKRRIKQNPLTAEALPASLAVHESRKPNQSLNL
jgi:predicted DNA-binding transcriptional regulator AlpA